MRKDTDAFVTFGLDDWLIMWSAHGADIQITKNSKYSGTYYNEIETIKPYNTCRGAESSLPVAHPGYQILSDIFV